MSLRNFVNLRALAVAALLLFCNWLAPGAHAQDCKAVAATTPKATVQEASLIQLPELKLQPTLSGAAAARLPRLQASLDETGPIPEGYCEEYDWMWVCSGTGDKQVCRWAYICVVYHESPV